MLKIFYSFFGCPAIDMLYYSFLLKSIVGGKTPKVNDVIISNFESLFHLSEFLFPCEPGIIYMSMQAELKQQTRA